MRFGLFKRVSFFAGFCSASIIFFVVKACVSSSRTDQSVFAPFHYLANYIEPSRLPAYFLVYFFWPLLYMGLVLRKKRVNSWALLVRGIKGRELIDIEFIVTVMVAGMIPGMLLAIPGGGAVSFQEFQYFLGAAFFLAGIRRSTLAVR